MYRNLAAMTPQSLCRRACWRPAPKQHKKPRWRNTGAAPDVPAGPQALGDRVCARPRLLDEVGSVHKLAPHAGLQQVCANNLVTLGHQDTALGICAVHSQKPYKWLSLSARSHHHFRLVIDQ